LLLVQLVLKIVEDQSSADRVFDGEGVDPAEVVVEVVVGLSPIVVGDGLELPGAAGSLEVGQDTEAMQKVEGLGAEHLARVDLFAEKVEDLVERRAKGDHAAKTLEVRGLDLGGVGAGGTGAVEKVIDGVVGDDAAEGVTGDVDLIEGGWGEGIGGAKLLL